MHKNKSRNSIEGAGKNIEGSFKHDGDETMHSIGNKAEAAGEASLVNEGKDKHGGDEAKQNKVEGAGEVCKENEVHRDISESFQGTSLNNTKSQNHIR